MWKQSYSLSVEREQHREHFLHQQKLQAVRSLIDNKSPHIRRSPNAKRLHAKREWSTQVQKDNHLLLSRLLAINLKTTTKPSKKPVPRTSSASSYQKSLESNRLSRENRSFKQRLRKQQSCYSAKQWESDHEHTEYLVTKLSENSGHFSRSHRQISPRNTVIGVKRRHRSAQVQIVEV